MVKWKYLWDDFEKRLDVRSFTFASVIFFIGGTLLLIKNQIAIGIYCMTMFLFTISAAQRLSLLDRINKLLKKGRR